MLRKTLQVAFLVVMLGGVVLAGVNQKGTRVDKIDTGSPVTEQQRPGGTPVIYGVSVLVDSMQNGYSTQASYTRQIYFDNASNSVVLVHRGSTLYGSLSGGIHYNWSTDGGATWGPRSSQVNGSLAQQSARHPSIVISNDGITPKPAGYWGELISGAFGGLGLFYDEEIGADLTTPTAWEDFDNDPSISVPDAPFVNGAGHVFFTVADLGASSGAPQWLMKSTDGGMTWSGISAGVYFIGDADQDAFQGAHGSFGPDGLHGGIGFIGAADGGAEYQLGWKPTTDGGATWGAIEWINLGSVTGVPANADLMENDANDYSECDFVMDGNNHPHIAATLIDTTGDLYYIVDIHHTGTGWACSVVAQVDHFLFPQYGTLDGRNENELARTPDGMKLIYKYVDGTIGPSSVGADSTTNVDIYLATLDVASGTWGGPVNETSTPTLREKFSNIAPIASSTKVKLLWTKFALDDQSDTGNPAYYYFIDANIPAATGIGDGTHARTFALKQNYPNPFNPTTNIEYTLNTASSVTLRIYNVMGQEVRTLVGGAVQPASTYSVAWDGKDNAGRAVTSGIYMYRLEAGQLTETRKMTLLK